MATIRQEIFLDMDPAAVWDVVADVGAVHTRFAPGFVTNTRLAEGGTREVTFANGVVATERIVTVDHDARRLAYAVTGSDRLTHHNASFRVFGLGDNKTRLVWLADILPDESVAVIGAMMEQGAEAIRRMAGN